MQSPIATVSNTRAEEWANILTHGFGAVASVMITTAMVKAAADYGDPWRTATLSVFGVALILTYGVSTLYHAVSEAKLKRIFRKLDHASIFVLIAGTYTPLMLVTLGGGWGWSLFGVVWGLAAAGLSLKLICFDRFGWTQLGLKLVMGWLILLAIGPVFAAMSTPGLLWVIAGGVAYTAGIAFFLWDQLHFNHGIWHLFVLLGSGCHVMAMITDVLPPTG